MNKSKKVVNKKEPNQTRILNVNLETQTAPVIQEVQGKEWIEYGTDDYRNLYPQFLIDLYYNSSTHAAICNTTADMIAGAGLNVSPEESENLEAYVKLKKFIASANSKGESLHSIIKKLSFDFKLQGAYAINVVWSKDRKSVELYHIPVERIRCGKPNAMGVVDTYYVSADWSNVRRNKPQAVPAFNVNDRTNPNAIIYDGMYSPNMQLYKTPDYSAACNWCLIDQKVAEFHLSNIQNGFSGSYFINFANGVPSAEERRKIERSITEKFTGSGNAGRFVLSFSDDKNRTPDIVPISMSDQDKTFLALQELLTSNILTGHRVVSPLLFGIRSGNNGLGNNAEELNSAFEVYLNTVIKPYQNNLLNCISKLLEVNGMNLPIEIVQNKPITSKWNLETLKEVMTQDEIREELGLEPLESDEKVAEDEFTKMSEEITELDKFILEYGEDKPDSEEWELVSDEKVEDEHEEFDFETELNQLHKTEFASTGKAIPNARSEQDGLDKEYNLYKVRYEYATAIASTNSREFCTKMLAAGKVYRKEDIIRMGNKAVNPGWGPNGSDYYSCWLYKGGGNCGHFFRRKIYFYKLGVATGNKISDATSIIGTVEARSRGFYPKANDSRVSRAPKNMPNNGFVNK